MAMTVARSAGRLSSQAQHILGTAFLAVLLVDVRRIRDARAARVNPVAPVLIIIPIAVVIALGLLTAWFIYCRYQGMYPALDMPSWSSGGTWKLYCRR